MNRASDVWSIFLVSSRNRQVASVGGCAAVSPRPSDFFLLLPGSFLQAFGDFIFGRFRVKRMQKKKKDFSFSYITEFGQIPIVSGRVSHLFIRESSLENRITRKENDS